jgi:hypothetical protein
MMADARLQLLMRSNPNLEILFFEPHPIANERGWVECMCICGYIEYLF